MNVMGRDQSLNQEDRAPGGNAAMVDLRKGFPKCVHLLSVAPY
jgi:hypothetical protein